MEEAALTVHAFLLAVDGTAPKREGKTEGDMQLGRVSCNHGIGGGVGYLLSCFG